MSDDTNITQPEASEEVDIDLLKTLLKLTPRERLEWHDRALELMVEMRRAGERFRDAQARAAPATERREG